MVTRYVTDMIADEYLSWQKGDSIFIATPTGSGKSTFILKRLLPHAIKLRKKIVYLCNRKTLNNQLLVESHRYLKTLLSTSELTQEECGSIFITTYQHCEEAKEYPYFVVNSERLSHDVSSTMFSMKHTIFLQMPLLTQIPITGMTKIFPNPFQFFYQLLLSLCSASWRALLVVL